MQDIFHIHTIVADGTPPDSGERRISSMSPKWMAICDELLANHGPVMQHNMGGSLSQFDIAMAGPQVELRVFEQVCYRLAISLGTDSEDDRAAVLTFREQWLRLVEAASEMPSPAALELLEQAAAQPCALVLDERLAVDQRQKLALVQLGKHLAAAYIKYSAASA